MSLEDLTADDHEVLDDLRKLTPTDMGYIVCRMSPILRDFLISLVDQSSDAARQEGARGGEPVAWRPEVRAFADLMEAKLRANDHKPGWKEDSDLDLFERLGCEMAELLAALHRHAKRLSWGDSWVMEDTVPLIGQEAADVANFAMMIADVCGALPPTSEGGGA